MKQQLLIILDESREHNELIITEIKTILAAFGLNYNLGTGEQVYYAASDLAEDISNMVLIDTRNNEE